VPNSNKLLARKSALLNATMSLGIDKIVRRLSRVLNATIESINIALIKRVDAIKAQDIVPRLHLQRFKRVGLSNYIKQCVEAW